MFGLGLAEITLILIVALLILGPEKLPKIAGKFGRNLGEFRKVVREFQTQLMDVNIDSTYPKIANTIEGSKLNTKEESKPNTKEGSKPNTKEESPKEKV